MFRRRPGRLLGVQRFSRGAWVLPQKSCYGNSLRLHSCVGVLVDFQNICWKHFWETHLGGCFYIINLRRVSFTKKAQITILFESQVLEKEKSDYGNNWRHSASFLDTTVLCCLRFFSWILAEHCEDPWNYYFQLTLLCLSKNLRK